MYPLHFNSKFPWTNYMVPLVMPMWKNEFPWVSLLDEELQTMRTETGRTNFFRDKLPYMLCNSTWFSSNMYKWPPINGLNRSYSLCIYATILQDCDCWEGWDRKNLDMEVGTRMNEMQKKLFLCRLPTLLSIYVDAELQRKVYSVIGTLLVCSIFILSWK